MSQRAKKDIDADYTMHCANATHKQLMVEKLHAEIGVHLEEAKRFAQEVPAAEEVKPE